MTEMLIKYLVSFVQGYPWFTVFILFVGFLRMSVKPIRSLIENYAASTPDKKDDKVVSDFFNSKAWVFFCYVLEVISSVKLK